MYIKTANAIIESFPYTVGMLRKENPNTSFPAKITPEILADWGIFTVSLAEKPSVNPGEVAVKDSIPSYVNGSWILNWTVRPMTEAEIDKLSSNIRNERVQKLLESDWTHVTDTKLTSEQQIAWATYRQALRDITSQPSFPYDISWPTKPE